MLCLTCSCNDLYFIMYLLWFIFVLRVLTEGEESNLKKVLRARPGFEPGTSRTLSENHTPRPTSRWWLDLVAHSPHLPSCPSRVLGGGTRSTHGDPNPVLKTHPTCDFGLSQFRHNLFDQTFHSLVHVRVPVGIFWVGGKFFIKPTNRPCTCAHPLWSSG